jgi:hypothetical protein
VGAGIILRRHHPVCHLSWPLSLDLFSCGAMRCAY